MSSNQNRFSDTWTERSCQMRTTKHARHPKPAQTRSILLLYESKTNIIFAKNNLQKLFRGRQGSIRDQASWIVHKFSIWISISERRRERKNENGKHKMTKRNAAKIVSLWNLRETNGFVKIVTEKASCRSQQSRSGKIWETIWGKRTQYSHRGIQRCWALYGRPRILSRRGAWRTSESADALHGALLKFGGSEHPIQTKTRTSATRTVRNRSWICQSVCPHDLVS